MILLIFFFQEFRKRLTVMTKEAYYYLSKTESLKAIASQFHILSPNWHGFKGAATYHSLISLVYEIGINRIRASVVT